MRKYFKKEKPIKNQIIVFKAKSSIYPEIGIFQTFENGNEEIYIPSFDEVERTLNIDWWAEIPN